MFYKKLGETGYNTQKRHSPHKKITKHTKKISVFFLKITRKSRTDHTKK
jgi:hypothetical protein